MDITTTIDALLPQIQCARCGYPDCRAYAGAIAAGEVPINRCARGGRYTIGRLAKLLDTTVLEPDSGYGVETARKVAVVDEQWCIGCTLCIQACPVDAISGAGQRMHAVIEAWCNGCELCLAPCPVDCIVFEPPRSGPENADQWLQLRATSMRDRYLRRQQRLSTASEKTPFDRHPARDHQQRRELIAEAISRERRRRELSHISQDTRDGA